MFQSSLLSLYHWPLTDQPTDVFEHFVEFRYDNEPRNYLYINTRQDVLNSLEFNIEFREFRDEICESCPEQKSYFLKLHEEHDDFDPFFFEIEFEKFKQRKAFNRLPEDERAVLAAEFNDWRGSAYQIILKGEAIRLNCDVSEVRSKVPVLTLDPDGCESKLADLPDEIFAKIMRHLDALDLFRMSLVCTKWRNNVYANKPNLTRAEHQITTHLLTFTDWLDPSWDIPTDDFEVQYRTFTHGLLTWYCGISTNIKSLFYGDVDSFESLIEILNHCPNLKYLELGTNEILNHQSSDFDCPLNLSLPNLEVFISQFHKEPTSVEFVTAILATSSRLEVFKGPLVRGNWISESALVPTQAKFENLVALDLVEFRPETVQYLAMLDSLNLTYLKLGCNSIDDAGTDYNVVSEQLKVYFHQLLPKLKKLEVLIMYYDPGITDRTIQILIDNKIRLHFASMFESCPGVIRNDDGSTMFETEGRITAESLLNYRDMLLAIDPKMDLSQISILIEDETLQKTLAALNSGFTVLQICCRYYDWPTVPGLSHPPIRRLINVDY